MIINHAFKLVSTDNQQELWLANDQPLILVVNNDNVVDVYTKDHPVTRYYTEQKTH